MLVRCGFRARSTSQETVSAVLCYCKISSFISQAICGGAFQSTLPKRRHQAGGATCSGVHQQGCRGDSRGKGSARRSSPATRRGSLPWRKKPRELTWVTGVVLAVLTSSFGVTGYSLPLGSNWLLGLSQIRVLRKQGVLELEYKGKGPPSLNHQLLLKEILGKCWRCGG